MNYYILTAELIANALIESVQKYGRDFLTFKQIENYGSKVVEILNHKGIEAVLLLSRYATNDMLMDYADYFVEIEILRSNGEKEYGIKLCDNVTVEQLIAEFRGYLFLDILIAFTREYSVKELK